MVKEINNFDDISRIEKDEISRKGNLDKYSLEVQSIIKNEKRKQTIFQVGICLMALLIIIIVAGFFTYLVCASVRKDASWHFLVFLGSISIITISLFRNIINAIFFKSQEKEENVISIDQIINKLVGFFKK